MIIGFTSRKELCGIFNCGEKKARKILREIGINHRLQLAPLEVEQFKQKVGNTFTIEAVVDLSSQKR